MARAVPPPGASRGIDASSGVGKRARPAENLAASRGDGLNLPDWNGLPPVVTRVQSFLPFKRRFP
ncbi:MAG: hypothetical protein LBO79_06210 [Zoogloeaceae bacterium]|nr:hypothetical protein [Zoogloeaceae bacterium]